MKELKYLNKYLSKYKWYLVSGVGFVILATALQIFPAQMVRRAIDLVVDNVAFYHQLTGTTEQHDFYGTLMRQILIYAGLILIMALLRGVFLYLTRQTIIVMSRLVEYDFKNEIFEHYQALPLSFYRKNSTGDIMNRISEDVTRVRMYLGPSMLYGVQLVVLFLMLTPIMVSISPKLTLYALSPLPLLSFGIYFVHNLIERQSEEIQKSQSHLSVLVQEAFSGIRVLKSFARERESTYHFSQESNKYKKKSLKLTWIQSLFFPLMTTLAGLSSILVVYAGGVEVINGSLTFGNIVEFIIYVNLLTWPVISLGWISSIVQRAEASQKRINEFLKTPAHVAIRGAEKRVISGKIEFKNISFVYPDTQFAALKGVSFPILPGETLAIIGATGSGKSTAVNLIGRLYEPTEGNILVDGLSIDKYDLASLRGQMGFVAQDVFLFSDTIYNNIVFGLAADQQPEAVFQAAKEADIYEEIIEFPEGFNTRVGERGVMLSGGQKQRISIARAIIRRPQILVLDDALSAVDTKTESVILENIHKIMKGKTIITVSHRISSAKLADRIIVLHDGKITEEGTHQSLLAKGGVYYDLHKTQTDLQAVT